MGRDRLCTALEVACLFYAGLGAAVALAGDTWVFAPWNDAMADALFGSDALPMDLRPLRSVLFGILGGSIVGKWVAAFFVARWGVRRYSRAAWMTSVVALGAWFSIDTTVSIASGAFFNVWMINVFPLVLVGGLLAALGPTTRSVTPARRRVAGDWVLPACMVALSLSGLVFAYGTAGPLMAPWIRAAAEAGMMGAPDEGTALLAFLAGPIGGTVFAHFVLLASATWFWPGERWAAGAVVASLAAWLVFDVSLSLWHDAAFNVLLIDLPCAGLSAVGLAAWGLTQRSLAQ